MHDGAVLASDQTAATLYLLLRKRQVKFGRSLRAAAL
jgi:hypothetical protein